TVSTIEVTGAFVFRIDDYRGSANFGGNAPCPFQGIRQDQIVAMRQLHGNLPYMASGFVRRCTRALLLQNRLNARSDNGRRAKLAPLPPIKRGPAAGPATPDFKPLLRHRAISMCRVSRRTLTLISPG